MISTAGRHLVVDAFGCTFGLLNDPALLEQLLVKSAAAVGAPVLHSYFHKFEPQGVTGSIVISTSHLAIHTWPESQYAAFDLFTCGDADPWPPMEALLHNLAAKRYVVCDLTRGSGDHMLTAIRERGGSKAHEVNRGDGADQAELRELLAGRHHIIYEGASAYQQMLLVEAQDVRMYLDGQLQFSSLDERFYHEALVHPAMTLLPAPERVLILGGGDGLALREVLKYPHVKHVDLIDLDPVVLRVATEIPALVALNEGALRDRRVAVHPKDAREFISRSRRKYDLIIADFPDPADEIISGLYTTELFGLATKRLAPGGILVCQSHSPEDAPGVFWSIGRTLQSCGLHTLGYHVEVPSFGDWGFHLAATRPLAWQGAPVAVPHRTLPADLASCFQFPQDVLAARDKAVINSKGDLTLHLIHAREAGGK